MRDMIFGGKNYSKLMDAIYKLESTHDFLKSKIENSFFAKLPRDYNITKAEVQDILRFSEKYITIQKDAVIALMNELSGARDKQIAIRAIGSQLAKISEALSYASDILDSIKTHHIESKKRKTLLRKGVNPYVYEVQSTYAHLNKLEDVLDNVSIDLCDALDMMPNNIRLLELLTRSSDLSEAFNAEKARVSSIMDKLIATGKYSDITASQMKLVFDIKTKKKQLEKDVITLAQNIATEANKRNVES